MLPRKTELYCSRIAWTASTMLEIIVVWAIGRASISAEITSGKFWIRCALKMSNTVLKSLNERSKALVGVIEKGSKLTIWTPWLDTASAEPTALAAIIKAVGIVQSS
jgi:hypothetical protein